ncbi:MAG TPA: hypothetical protein VES42_16405, partial [Pilimelia sp.]|nr:hypothetical protein [Pilimelia sp.]
AVPSAPITGQELRNATLQVPRWPAGQTADCPRGPVRFDDGESAGAPGLKLTGDPVHVDVDRDGDEETVVALMCAPEGADYQVLAYGRTPAGGIRLVGQVLATAGSQGRPGVDVRHVHAIAAGSNGRVRVDVGDYPECCATASDLPQHQWRTYRFDGERFRQSGGPTSFGPNPKVGDLGLTASDVVMTRQADRSWRGTVVVRVTNTGPGAPPAQVEVNIGGLVRGATGWSGCTNDEFTPLCTVGVVPQGATRTLRLTVSTGTGSGRELLPSGGVVVAVHAQAGPDAAYPEPRLSNNRRQLYLIEG